MILKICEFDGCVCVIADENVYFDVRIAHAPIQGKTYKFKDESKKQDDQKKGLIKDEKKYKKRIRHARLYKRKKSRRFDEES